MNILIKIVLVPGFLFREQPSEPFREESIESTVHEPSSDTNWWSAGQEKKYIFDWFVVQEDRHAFREE